jgi:hypothetical protein
MMTALRLCGIDRFVARRVRPVEWNQLPLHFLDFTR